MNDTKWNVSHNLKKTHNINYNNYYTGVFFAKQPLYVANFLPVDIMHNIHNFAGKKHVASFDDQHMPCKWCFFSCFQTPYHILNISEGTLCYDWLIFVIFLKSQIKVIINTNKIESVDW